MVEDKSLGGGVSAAARDGRGKTADDHGRAGLRAGGGAPKPGSPNGADVVASPDGTAASGFGGAMSPVARFVGRLALALAAICLGIVTAVSVLSTVWLMTDAKTGNLTQSMSIYTVASPVSWAVLAAGAAGAVLVLALCLLAWRRGGLLDGPAASWALAVATLAAQLVLIFALQTRDGTWGDFWMVSAMVDRAWKEGVQAVFEGPYKTLFYDARLYFACYPFQASYFWLLLGLRYAFGEYSYMALQVISALGNALAVASVLSLGRSLTRSSGARRVLWVLVALMLPMYWLSTFLYLNALGCGFALAFLAMQARSMRSRGLRARLLWCAGSLLPLAIALCVKATFVLFAIGTVLAWAVLSACGDATLGEDVARGDAACKQGTRMSASASRPAAKPPVRRLPALAGLAASIVVVMAARGISNLPFEALRAASGGYEFGDALTTLNHLELGLRMGQGEFYVSVDGGEYSFAPGGWSNHANAVWEASGENAEVQNTVASQLLAQHAVEFATDPAYALWFFATKLATEWADPTYQSLYYLAECEDAAGDRVCNPADLDTPLGLACTVLTFVLDGYQATCLAAALGFVLWARHRRGSGIDGPMILLALTFFTGFGCYLLWEAKSVYVLPFAIVVLPLAASGLDLAFSYVHALCLRLSA